MDKISIYNNIKTYLIDRKWELEGSNNRYDFFIPDLKLNIESDFKLYLPNQIDKSDFYSNIERIIEILSQIHEESADDLSEIVIDNKQILKFHLEHINIKDGKPLLAQFENIISKIKNILYETASFTILKKPHIFEKEIEEAERYINYVRFIKNEPGSLITKVELPNEEDIQIKNIFESGIKGFVVNNKLFEVINYINTKILLEEFIEPSDEELLKDKDYISVNITEKLRDFYHSIDLMDVDFELLRIEKPKKLSVTGLTEKKLGNLLNFAKEVKKRINEIKPMSLEGKIVQLSSRDVDGDKNSIKMRTTIDNVGWGVLISLSSEDYHKAVNAHDTNKTVQITGILEKRKTEYKVTELNEFRVKGQNQRNNEVKSLF
ncbi:MAG: hypothetical protein HW421_2904 [Ignavibacteria bacterium]|nr:hypothetical protein [Ignavibacteria bacterium]